MRHLARAVLVILLVVGASGVPSQSQEDLKCRSLDRNEVKRLLPERVPLEMETIPVDMKNSAGLEFPDKTRIAIAPLITSGYESGIQKKYEFILVSETRLALGTWILPGGIVGIGVQRAERDAPTITLVARDISGTVIERICLFFDNSMPPVRLALIPKGEREFELRIGSYAIMGYQR